MFKRLLYLLTFAALVNLGYQYWPRGESGELIPVMNAERDYGFVDEYGRVRIEFEWYLATPFDSAGLALVTTRDWMYGFIDRTGKVIIPVDAYKVAGSQTPLFEISTTSDVDSFFNEFGLVQLTKGKKTGWVNRQGEVVIPFEWDSFGSFDKEGMVIGEKGGYKGVVDKNGDTIIAPRWYHLTEFGPQGIAAAARGSTWRFFDRSGSLVFEEKTNYQNLKPFAENGLALASAKIYCEKENREVSRYGWVNLEGKMVIAPQWFLAGSFDSQGMAPVGRKEDGKHGWINEKGEVVIPLEFSKVEAFNEWGLARVKQGQEWAGVTPAIEDQLWGLIDRKGNWVVKPTWSEMDEADCNGRVRVEVPFKGWGIISHSGEYIVKPEWTEIMKFNQRDTVIALSEDSRCSLLDNEGNILLERQGNLYPLDKNGRALWNGMGNSFQGWLDRTGRLVVSPPDDDIWKPLRWGGFYTMGKTSRVQGVRKWLGKLRSLFTKEEIAKEIYECRTYDKDGNLIWSSTWLRKTTKAWLFLIAALVPLLIVLWFGRKKRKLLKS